MLANYSYVIDPPYNTGQDFIYNDDFKDNIYNYLTQTGQLDKAGNRLTTNLETSGRFHSDWLSMIYPRLKLARNLIADDGFICIHIDDNELKNLRQVADEVFGEENLINLVAVKMSHLSGVKMSHVDKKLPKIKEFILIYAKNKNKVSLQPIYQKAKWDEALSRYSQYIENFDAPYQTWKYIPVRKAAELFNVDFSDTDKRESFLVTNAKRIFRTARNRALPATGAKGIFSKVTTATGLEKFVLNDEEVLFASEKMQKFEGKLQPVNILGDIWSDIGINNLHNEGGVAFRNGKKPIKLLKRLITLLGVKNGLVLDFFAGSGSTAHAVSEMNTSEKLNNKFIMVQLPEQCDKEEAGFEKISELTLHRIKNVLNESSSHGDLFHPCNLGAINTMQCVVVHLGG